jgi:hypothetical protein
MSQTHHTVDPKFTYFDKRARKDVVLYVGLLDAAHRAGLVAIETEILAYPCGENNETCIIRATAIFERDPDRPLRFTAIGDANPRNVGAAIAPHFIRMAETRAKARALRDALNIGMVTAEELGGADQPAEDDDGHTASQPRPQPAPARNAAPAFVTPRAAPAPAPALVDASAAYSSDLDWTAFWKWARPQGYHSKADMAKALGKADSAINDWTPAQLRTALEVAHQRAG